jgi:hypothetical protein
VELHFVRSRAFIDAIEFADGPVRGVGLDLEADGAIRKTAETVDVTFEAGSDLQNGLPQRLALDEVVRQLIERPVEMGVEPIVGLKDADENLPVTPAVLVEGKAGALADENALAAAGRKEVFGDLHGLVENVKKDLQLRVIDEKETDGRLVEDRTNEGFPGRKAACRWPDL